MDHRARKHIAAIVTVALGIGLAAAPSARAGEKNHRKHADLLGLIGLGAGFGVGMLAGFHVYDEAIDSEHQLWTATLVSAAAGCAIGYAWGAHIDRKHEAADSLDAALSRALEEGRMAIAQGRRGPAPALIAVAEVASAATVSPDVAR